MTKFHAVMLDETGCEFGADIEAQSKTKAHDKLQEDYPESRCVQLESGKDAQDREQRMHAHIARGGDWDDDGRPIFHHSYWDED